MSETREPEYIVLDYDDDFKLDAYVDATGEQRFVLTGYIQKRKTDGVYQAPLLPQLFYGANGVQLDTWRQNFTSTGEQTVLRRDSGNPSVPDSDLAWRKISSTPTRQPVQVQVQPTATLEIPWVPIALLAGIPLSLYLIYKLFGSASKW